MYNYCCSHNNIINYNAKINKVCYKNWKEDIPKIFCRLKSSIFYNIMIVYNLNYKKSTFIFISVYLQE